MTTLSLGVMLVAVAVTFATCCILLLVFWLKLIAFYHRMQICFRLAMLPVLIVVAEGSFFTLLVGVIASLRGIGVPTEGSLFFFLVFGLIVFCWACDNASALIPSSSVADVPCFKLRTVVISLKVSLLVVGLYAWMQRHID